MAIDRGGALRTRSRFLQNQKCRRLDEQSFRKNGQFVPTFCKVTVEPNPKPIALLRKNCPQCSQCAGTPVIISPRISEVRSRHPTFPRRLSQRDVHNKRPPSGAAVSSTNQCLSAKEDHFLGP
jgi:hypothetical protein